MANEATNITLLGNQGDPVEYIVAAGSAIAKGSLMVITSSPQTVQIHDGTVGVGSMNFAGIAATEHVSGPDASNKLAVLTHCLADLTAGSTSADAMILGQPVVTSASNNNTLDSGNTFTWISVSNNDSAGSGGGVIGSSDSSFNDGAFAVYSARTSNKRLAFISNTSASFFFASSLVQQDNDSQKLLTTTTTSSLLSAYFNGTFQESNSWNGSYLNETFKIGQLFINDNNLNGTIQEIILFPSAITNLTALHNDINNYYNIY